MRLATPKKQDALPPAAGKQKNRRCLITMANAILFDMDGVLFDTEKLALNAGTQVLKELGFAPTQAFMLSLCGITEAAGEEIMQKHFGSSFNYNVFAAKMKEQMVGWMQQNGVPLKPGLRQAIAYLQKNAYQLAIASSNGIQAINAYLDAVQLGNAFAAIVHGEMVANSKPHPEIFAKAAAALGLPPS